MTTIANASKCFVINPRSNMDHWINLFSSAAAINHLCFLRLLLTQFNISILAKPPEKIKEPFCQRCIYSGQIAFDHFSREGRKRGKMDTRKVQLIFLCYCTSFLVLHLAKAKPRSVFEGNGTCCFNLAIPYHMWHVSFTQQLWLRYVNKAHIFEVSSNVLC